MTTDLITQTPLEYSPSLSEKYAATIYLKREDLQPVRSFKIRGAYNKITLLTDEEKKQGVVAASAGNHAQWVALTCAHLGVQWTIFMPQTTPSQKVRKTKKFGGKYINVQLVWDTFDDAYIAAIAYSNESKAVFIHPFNDPLVIQGQWGVAIEILDQSSVSFDHIVVAVGGGGLIAGVWSIFKEQSPDTKIIAVESDGSASMQAALKAWEPVSIWKVDTFADGVAVQKVWRLTHSIAKKVIDESIVVHDWQLATTMLELLDDQWIITEPAGALAVSGLEQIADQIEWKIVCCIICWWNFDFERLSQVKEKSLRWRWLRKYFLITFPQRPGALKEFLGILWPQDDIVRFEYIKKSAKETWPALVWIESNESENFVHLIKKFENQWVKFEDITDDEVLFDLLV